MTTTLPKLIHVARIETSPNHSPYLYLRAKDLHHFAWYLENEETELKLPLASATCEEALSRARQHWKLHSFRTVHCGFRYALPERDEHGWNALFHQMVASYSSPNGVYFDEELGYNCLVNFASQEALSLWKSLRK